MMEKHASIDPLMTFLKESGAIIAFITGLLFIWGYLLFAFVHIKNGFPGVAFADRTVPEYLVFGAIVAITYFFPAVLIGYLLMSAANRLTRGRVATWWSSRNRSGPFNPVVVVVLLFGLSIILLNPVAERVAAGARKGRVKSVTPSSSSKVVTAKYEGLIFVTKKDTVYIFVDKLGGDATVYLLNEADVGEIIFSRE